MIQMVHELFGHKPTLKIPFCVAVGRVARVDWCPLWAPCRGDGGVSLCAATADQKAARSPAGLCVVHVAGIEMGPLELPPVLHPLSVGAGPYGQAFPVGWTPRR